LIEDRRRFLKYQSTRNSKFKLLWLNKCIYYPHLKTHL